MKIFDKEIRTCKIKRNLNYKLIPVNAFKLTEESASLVNRIHEEILKDGEYHSIVRTRSGGISISQENFRLPMYDIRNTTSCIEITVVDFECYRIQLRGGDFTEDNKLEMSGSQAEKKWFEVCKQFGIDMEQYSISNGLEVKQNIEKPYICTTMHTKIGKTYFGVHHIDFHNSYPSGLVNTHPEFRPVVKYLYDKRKENNDYKQVLNLTIGRFQSKWNKRARFAHLAKDAIADNNRRIEDLANRLEASGRKCLLFNTDGIWYSGNIYHGEGEGDDICQWHNDHKDCVFRVKSAGAYEFIEDGKYSAVVRGTTKLDLAKPRDMWKWGDIFKDDAEPYEFRLDKEGWVIRDGKKI